MNSLHNQTPVMPARPGPFRRLWLWLGLTVGAACGVLTGWLIIG